MNKAKKGEQKPEKYEKLEKNMMCFAVVAAIVGFCLAVGCTKMIIPAYVLTGYGIILIIIGLLIILFDDKIKNKFWGEKE